MNPERYEDIAKDLFSKLNKLTAFTKHSPSIGSFHEHLVREAIKPFLPARFSIKTGFIFAPPNNTSYQCDLLIIDNQESPPPLFQDGDLVVVLPLSVVCVIEVKTRLTKKTFYDAIINLHRSRQISKDFGVKPHSTYIFSFDGVKLSPSTLNKWYIDAPVPDDILSYPYLIYILSKGCLEAQVYEKKFPIHKYIIGEESEELKSRALSIFFQKIIKDILVYSKDDCNPFTDADLRDLYWAKEYLRFGKGIITPDE
ncbi:MAG: DUF6602 domain-containing protein [Candidatus Hodarchaeales archaeon]